MNEKQNGFVCIQSAIQNALVVPLGTVYFVQIIAGRHFARRLVCPLVQTARIRVHREKKDFW